ncbi:MAG TPA: chemotaxis protein CheA [Thermoanaerobaculia bacterium]|nr:chemotaxis protein CheA [Thermoanaerobaculia bacterium]
MTIFTDEERTLLMTTFVDEAQELLTSYEEALVELERNPRSEALINTIFRVAHTMKGNASTLGLDSVIALAHATEDLLDGVRERRIEVTPEVITLLLACSDHFKAHVQAATGSGAIPESTPDLVIALRDATATGTTASAGPAAIDEVKSGGASVRTSIAKLDGMLALAGEISIARSRMRTLIAALGSTDLRDAQEQLDRLCADLESDLMRIRMIPIGPVLNQQSRVVRDLARSSGKLVELLCIGGDVEADTAVIEHLRSPITHMVRNALDHGIESPEERRRRGKPEAGTVTIRAAHDAGMLIVEVSDDGAGIDAERVLRKAQRLGLTHGDGLTEAEIHRLIFQPGFTTAETVTELSGRGVGMDVVHQSIVALRGSISIRSTPGEGTAFTIRAPLSVAIIDALAVRAGGDTFVIPLEFDVECMDVDEQNLRGARTGVVDIRGHAMPFMRLATCMGTGDLKNVRKAALIVTDRKTEAALVLDRLIGRVEAVVKPLGKLPNVPGVGGATILGGGDVALIVDIPRLIQKEICEVA